MNALAVLVLAFLAASLVAAWVNRPRAARKRRHAEMRRLADEQGLWRPWPGLDQRLAQQRADVDQARRTP